MKLTEYENIAMPISQRLLRLKKTEPALTVGQYIQGAVEGKSTIMRQSFYSSAQIHGYLDGDLLADPIQVLYDYVEQHPPAVGLKYVIRSIDWEGNAATASVEIENWHEHTYTDFFTLLKINNQWRITGKIFVQH